MRLLKTLNQNGAALGIVVVLTTIIVLVGTYVLSAGYNQTKQIDAVGIQRTKTYFRAQAGVVDALWRIRTNAAAPAGPTGSFATDNYDPNPYYIDIETNTTSSTQTVGTSDVMVDIGMKDTSAVVVPAPDSNSNLRRIVAKGLET